MAKKTFAGPESALDFLNQEQQRFDRLSKEQSRIAPLAARTLQEKGAFVFGIEGYYGGRPGLLGSALLGVRLIQGTEPVEITKGSRVALRHGPEEKDTDVYLVRSTGLDGTYLRKMGGVIAVFTGARVKVPYVKAMDLPHLEAVDLLVTSIGEQLEPIAPEGDYRLHPKLPQVPRYGNTLKGGELVNLREVDPNDINTRRLPIYH